MISDPSNTLTEVSNVGKNVDGVDESALLVAAVTSCSSGGIKACSAV